MLNLTITTALIPTGILSNLILTWDWLDEKEMFFEVTFFALFSIWSIPDSFVIKLFSIWYNATSIVLLFSLSETALLILS